MPYCLWRVGGTLVCDDHKEWATDISKLTLNHDTQLDHGTELDHDTQLDHGTEYESLQTHSKSCSHDGNMANVMTTVPTLESSLEEEVSGYKACMVGKFY